MLEFQLDWKISRVFVCKFEHPTKLSFIHSLLHLVQQKFLPQIGLFFLSVAIVNCLIFQGTFNLQMEKVPSKFSSFFKQMEYSDIRCIKFCYKKSSERYLSIYSSCLQLRYPQLRYFCSYAILNWVQKKNLS